MRSTSITCDSCGAELSERHDSYARRWRLSVEWEEIPTTSHVVSVFVDNSNTRLSGDFCSVGCLFDEIYALGFSPHEGRV
jgi:hypothetical protein